MTAIHHTPETASPHSPSGKTARLVIQVGFAGSRRFFNRNDHPDIDEAAFQAAVEEMLRSELAALPAALHLSDRHFLCGISQLAIGADSCFARACAALRIPHRLFLPQPRDGYLTGADKRGRPDFSPAQREATAKVLDSPNIVQERVVSHAATRIDRFDDTNIEIVRVSDVVICLFRKDAAAPIGGTRDMMNRALRRRRVVREIQIEVGSDGQPVFRKHWHHLEVFSPPRLPDELDSLHLEDCDAMDGCFYLAAFTRAAGALSTRHQSFFKRAALFIVGAHVLATACAVIAVTFHPPGLLGLILAEALLLTAGGLIHRRLQTSRAVRVWSMSRLVAQIAASLQALSGVAAYPEYLFTLPIPESLRGLRRTLCFFHLVDTCRLQRADWSSRRDVYLAQRIGGDEGQLAYYRRKQVATERLLHVAHAVFYSATVLAILATAGKVVAHLHLFDLPDGAHDIVPPGFAVLAILLPVIAVAVLSLAAAFDLEAKAQTFKDLAAYLAHREDQLRQASTEREFQSLALDIETHLLGETTTWYSRQAYLGIA